MQILNTAQKFWQGIPEGDRISRGLCRRAAIFFPKYSESKLKNPIFLIGYNNGGKSRLANILKEDAGCCVYPDEGNKEFWFKDFFPWIEEQPNVTPIWYDPDLFVTTLLSHRTYYFSLPKAYLGAYQALMNSNSIINDSGMLGALTPEMTNSFPNAKYIHVIRDGRVASYLSARKEWCNMMRIPSLYSRYGISLNFQDVLARMIKYWAWTVNRVKSVETEQPNSVFEIQYEEWCRNPERIYRDLLYFTCNQTQEPRNDQFKGLINMNETILSDLTERDLETMDTMAGKELRALGYI